MAAYTFGTAHGHGVWGPVTATLDWCEANYQFSPYIAEMANTLSNIITMWFALHGTYMAWRDGLEPRFLAGFAGFALVGLGSMAFHTTLRFGPQLADELPMIYVASYGFFVLYDTRPGFNMRNARSLLLLAGVLAFDVLFTWTYHLYRNPVYHQVVFAALVLASLGRVTYLLRGCKAYATKIPEDTKTTILRMFWAGAGLFLFGFFIWNLDNIFCSTLTGWKHAIGWPLAFLLEGHSWWHALTAAGTYLMIQGVIYLTLCVKDDHQKYALHHTFGIPYVRRAPSTDLKTVDVKRAAQTGEKGRNQ